VFRVLLSRSFWEIFLLIAEGLYTIWKEWAERWIPRLLCLVKSLEGLALDILVVRIIWKTC